MSKAEIVKKEEAPVLATPTGRMEMGFVEDEDRKGVVFPRLHLFQGTGAEQKLYGKQDAGALIDTSSGDVIDPATRFVAVRNWCEWIRFGETMSDPPIYRYTSKADVPAEDLQWGPNNEPPVAVKHSNWVCLFEGLPLPLVATWKKSGLREADTFGLLVARYRGRAAFTMGHKTMDSPKGQYLVLRPRPAATLEDTDPFYVEALGWFNTLKAIDAAGLAEKAAPEKDEAPF